jgi:hypothetical protein
MDTITLQHAQEEIYVIDKISSESIYALGTFLAIDVSVITKDLIIEGLMNNKYYFADATNSRRIGDAVYIRFSPDDEMPPYSIPFDKLVKLIDAWVKIYDDLPEYITITIDENYDFKITYEQ